MTSALHVMLLRACSWVTNMLGCQHAHKLQCYLTNLYLVQRRGPVFRAHFGGGPGGGFRRHAGPAPAQQQPANPAAQLLHFLPVLFLLLFTFMQMPSQPVRCAPLADESPRAGGWLLMLPRPNTQASGVVSASRNGSLTGRTACLIGSHAHSA